MFVFAQNKLTFFTVEEEFKFVIDGVWMRSNSRSVMFSLYII